MGMVKQFVSGAAIGAGVTYLYDSGCGAGRRALLQQKATRLKNQTEDAVGKATRDASNRLRGMAAQQQWPPSGRWAAGLTGVALMLSGRSRGGLSGVLRFLAGSALLARGYRNKPFFRELEEESSGGAEESSPSGSSSRSRRSLNPAMSTSGESGLETGSMAPPSPSH